MRHPIESYNDKRLCPITGEQFDVSWSEIECYDSCIHCNSKNYKSVSERLSELEQKRNEEK